MAGAAPVLYKVDDIKCFLVDQLRNISLELGLPILDEETNQKLSKPILREKLIAFIQSQDPVLEENLNANPDSYQNVPEIEPWFSSLPKTGAVILRVPKASRLPGSRSFCEALDRVTALNTKEPWEKLFEFARAVLAKPPRAGKNNSSLATIINKRLANWDKGLPIPKPPPPKSKKRKKKSTPSLGNQVAAKLGIGDVKGAVRLCTSNDVVLPPTPEVIQKLKDKHPPPHEDTQIPLFEDLQGVICDRADVRRAINSFPNGSGGGPDGLLPQFLKDFSDEAMGEQANKFLDSLVNFLNNIVFAGKIPNEACAVFFGAKLIALSKGENGIRPIAIGMVLRRLASKVLMIKLNPKCEELFWPNQVGVGTPLGAELAIHSARKFITSASSMNKVCLQTDFSNAFNCLRRDKALQEIREKVPEIFKYAWQSYGNPSNLFLGQDEIIMSQEGIQQGDPLGPFIYALTTMVITQKIKSPLSVFYLDDACVAGDLDTVLQDYEIIKEESKSLGLTINPTKCKLFAINPTSQRCIQAINEFPGVVEIKAENLNLLGAPILQEANEVVLYEKLDSLKTMAERLKLLSSHDALFLLRQCFAIPKVMYLLRTSTAFRNSVWCEEFDETLRKSLQSILNVELEGSVWEQCSLPIKLGGLGIRKVSDVAGVAYLSSVCATSRGVQAMVSAEIFEETNNHFDSAKQRWIEKAGPEYQLPINPSSQKEWDLPLCKRKLDLLLASATSDKDKARLLAVSTKNASDWLQAFPIPSLGLKLDNNSLKIACAVRLGANICQPHNCIRCGKEVDPTGTHGLSCDRSAGRHSRHNRVNYIIKRALGVVNFNARLEPVNLSSADGAQGLVPDGVTIQTYRNGKPLIWDFTCHDTLAHTYVNTYKWSCRKAGRVAEEAEKDKVDKYKPMSNEFHMVPICVESLGVWGPAGYKFIKDLGRMTCEKTKEKRSTSFIMQSISMEVQRSNVACITATVDSPKLLNELFELFHTNED